MPARTSAGLALTADDVDYISPAAVPRAPAMTSFGCELWITVLLHSVRLVDILVRLVTSFIQLGVKLCEPHTGSAKLIASHRE